MATVRLVNCTYGSANLTETDRNNFFFKRIQVNILKYRNYTCKVSPPLPPLLPRPATMQHSPNVYRMANECICIIYPVFGCSGRGEPPPIWRPIHPSSYPPSPGAKPVLVGRHGMNDVTCPPFQLHIDCGRKNRS